MQTGSGEEAEDRVRGTDQGGGRRHCGLVDTSGDRKLDEAVIVHCLYTGFFSDRAIKFYASLSLGLIHSCVCEGPTKVEAW